MKYKLFVLLIFFSCSRLNSFSQNRNIVIADANDKTVLPYATIKILNKNVGYYSDKNGIARIPKYESDSILVEYTGHFSYRNKIDKTLDTIFLNRKLYELSPVVVGSYKTQHALGRFKYKKINTIFLSESTEYALKIDLSEIKGNYQVKQLFLPLSFNNNTFNTCTCKLHLYKEDENRQPGQDILNKPILLQKDYFLNKDFYIDISDQDIFLSEKTLFIGIECIIDNTTAIDVSKLTEKRKFNQEMKNSPVTLYISNEKQILNNSYNHTFFRLLNSKTYRWYGGNSKSKDSINFSAGLIVLSNH